MARAVSGWVCKASSWLQVACENVKANGTGTTSSFTLNTPFMILHSGLGVKINRVFRGLIPDKRCIHTVDFTGLLRGREWSYSAGSKSHSQRVSSSTCVPNFRPKIGRSVDLAAFETAMDYYGNVRPFFEFEIAVPPHLVDPGFDPFSPFCVFPGANGRNRLTLGGAYPPFNTRSTRVEYDNHSNHVSERNLRKLNA